MSKLIKPKTKGKVEKKTQRCTHCGETKVEIDFYMSDSEIYKSIRRQPICKDCIVSIYLKYKRKFNSEDKAIYRVCELLNIYYDIYLLEGVKSQAKNMQSIPIKIYLQKINSLKQYKGKTFIEHNSREEEPEYVDATEITPIEEPTMDEEQAKNDTIRLLGYAPYSEYDEKDQRNLYNELILYLDEDTLEDPFKISVIIQIVDNNNKIKKTNLAINRLTSSMASFEKNAQIVENLTKVNSQLTGQNDKLSKENNIALKYRSGSNSKNSTLGSMMKNLRELGFEKAEQDYYDMSKSYGMKVSADISHQSIVSVLGLDDNDYNNIVKLQRETIQDLQTKELDYKEEVRKLLIENSQLQQEVSKAREINATNVANTIEIESSKNEIGVIDE